MTTTVAHSEATDSPYALSHLDALESEAVHIFREVAGEFERRWCCSPAARTPS